VTHLWSWHWIFAANVPLAIVVIARARTQVPSVPARERGALDVAGIVVLAIGLLATMVGLTRLDTQAASFGGRWVTPAAGAVALAAFAALAQIERRASEPIVSPALFTRRQLAVTYALEVLVGALEGALFFVPAALVAAEHLSYAAAGLVAAVGAIVFVAVIPIAGRALDAFGSRAVLGAGSLLTALGLALFAFALPSLPAAILALAVAGVGFGALLGAPTRYIVANEAPANMRATAVGLLSIFLIIGQIAGGSLAGGIAGKNIADTAGYRTAYLAFAALAIATALVTIALASRKDERRAATG
jgi:MFS family permease